jgi:hypothetical protein
MNKYPGLILLAAALLLTGCSKQIGDYVAASSISRNGLARDAAAMRRLDGQEIMVWGSSTPATSTAMRAQKRFWETGGAATGLMPQPGVSI